MGEVVRKRRRRTYRNLSQKELRGYVPGLGCVCSAWNSGECSCPGVDWTPYEIYRLRAVAKSLRAKIQRLKSALAAYE